MSNERRQVDELFYLRRPLIINPFLQLLPLLSRRQSLFSGFVMLPFSCDQSTFFSGIHASDTYIHTILHAIIQTYTHTIILTFVHAIIHTKIISHVYNHTHTYIGNNKYMHIINIHIWECKHTYNHAYTIVRTYISI